MIQPDQQFLSKLLFPAGLYDMMGNTWEWTSTPFPGAQPMYVLRGASWIDTADGSANHKARVTTRWVIYKQKLNWRRGETSWLVFGFGFFPGWETLLTLPRITSDSGVLPTRDRKDRRKKAKLNSNTIKELKKKGGKMTLNFSLIFGKHLFEEYFKISNPCVT